MIQYLVKRCAAMALVIFGVATLTFFLMHFIDGDPAAVIALDRYGSQLASSDMIRELAAQEGLDRPVTEQYGNWLSMVARGRLGYSLKSGLPVVEEIHTHFPYTLRLALTAICITAAIAIPGGMFAAHYPDGWFDRISRTAAGLNAAIPNFYMAILLILVFSVNLRWLPSYGSGDPGHLVLPVAVLVLSQAGFTLRLVRSCALRILDAPHVRYAVLRGIPKLRIQAAHVMKNIAVPVLTYLSLQFLMAVEGAVIVETVFARPGIGKLFFDSVMARDFTMIQALILLSGLMITLTNFAVDLAGLATDRQTAPEAG